MDIISLIRVILTAQFGQPQLILYFPYFEKKLNNFENGAQIYN